MRSTGDQVPPNPAICATIAETNLPSPSAMATSDLQGAPLTRRKKQGFDATPEGKAARIAKLRAKSPTTGNTNAVVNPNAPLTQKQRDFAMHWSRGETICNAAIRAGYANNGGATSIAYRLVEDPRILAIYNREKALYAESCQMTRQKVLEGLLEAAEMAKLVNEPASMVSAWREVGKICGFYEPVKRTIDVNIQGNVTVKRLQAMSNEDLLKLVKSDVQDVVFEEIIDEEGEE